MILRANPVKYVKKKLTLRAYRLKHYKENAPSQMHVLVQRIRYSISSLNFWYLLLVPLVVLISILEFLMVFVLTEYQYLDVLISIYFEVFLFYLFLIVGSAILISLTLVKLGSLVLRKVRFRSFLGKKSWTILMVVLFDGITIWFTYYSLNIILSPEPLDYSLLLLPFNIAFWSVLWALMYMRIRFTSD